MCVFVWKTEWVRERERYFWCEMLERYQKCQGSHDYDAVHPTLLTVHRNDDSFATTRRLSMQRSNDRSASRTTALQRDDDAFSDVSSMRLRVNLGLYDKYIYVDENARFTVI